MGDDQSRSSSRRGKPRQPWRGPSPPSRVWDSGAIRRGVRAQVVRRSRERSGRHRNGCVAQMCLHALPEGRLKRVWWHRRTERVRVEQRRR